MRSLDHLPFAFIGFGARVAKPKSAGRSVRSTDANQIAKPSLGMSDIVTMSLDIGEFSMRDTTLTIGLGLVVNVRFNLLVDDGWFSVSHFEK